jgi:hypothetical protein
MTMDTIPGNHSPRSTQVDCILHGRQLADLMKDVQDIKHALLGDNYGTKGFAERVRDVEGDVKELKRAMVKLDLRVTAIAAGISAAVGVVKYLVFQ